MTRFIILALIATLGMTGIASAQPFRPGLPMHPHSRWNAPRYPGGAYANYGYAWDGTSGASTELEGALTGQARWWYGRGLYNQLTADAFNRWQEGYTKYLQNEEQRIHTYFKEKQLNADYRAGRYPVPLTKEKLDQWILMDQPQRLTRTQYNIDTGAIRWPALLQLAQFDDQRLLLDNLFARRTADEFGTDSGFYRQAAHSIHMLQDRLKDYLHQEERFFTDEEYMVAKKFLTSLLYEARFAPDIDGMTTDLGNR